MPSVCPVNVVYDLHQARRDLQRLQFSDISIVGAKLLPKWRLVAPNPNIRVELLEVLVSLYRLKGRIRGDRIPFLYPDTI